MYKVNPDQFTHQTDEALAGAHELAMHAGHAQFSPLHLAVALLSEQPGIFHRAINNVGGEEAAKAAERVFNQALKKLPCQSPPPGEIPASPSLKKVIRHSQKSRDDSNLAVDQLIIGLLDDSQIGDLLKEAGVATARVKSELKRLPRKEGKKVGSAFDDISFPALKTYGRDLVEQAGKLDPVIGRDEEIKKVVGILSKRTKNNAVLIGPPSLDSTAIVEGVAERIARGDVPSNLGGVRLIALDMDDLIVGVKYGRMFKERLEVVLKDVVRARGKLIVFIDEIHQVLDAWQPPWTVAANLFKPMLAKGQLRCIGATTFEKYRKCVEKDAALLRWFRQVHVAEPSVPDTISRGLKDRHEGHHGVRIRDWGLVAAHLCSKYITGCHLSHKAIRLVDEGFANVRVQVDSQPEEIDNLMRKRMQLEEASQIHLVEVREEWDNLREKREPLTMKYKKEKERITEVNSMLTKTVGPEHIYEVVSSWTGKPVSRLGQNEKERLVGLAERLHQKAVGQDQAVSAVAEAVLRSRAGLGRPQQPTSSFLFLGPTGVGKTELAKALAEQLFDDEKFLIQINMAEYVEQHSVSRLIGAPPGYVGQGVGGLLTEAVRGRPYSVVLFDWVEIAHIAVMNKLLKVLDEGSLTDGQGRTVDFRNTVIIMTSNLGAKHLLSGLMGECTMQVARDQVMQEVRRHFRPELLNLFDEIVVFDPLPHEQLRKVARLQVKDVASRLAKRGVALAVTDAALDFVLADSYDPVNGAWPIRRLVEDKLVTKLAKMLLMEEIDEYSTVNIDAGPNGQDLVYRVEKNGGFVKCHHLAEVR